MSASGSWDWSAAAARVGATPDGRFNAGALTLPARAVTWVRVDGTQTTYTGAQMMRRAGEFASVFAALGVRAGDRVAGLMNRRPANFAAALGVWRVGAVYVPLFSGFGGEGLLARMLDCGPKLVVTDAANLPALAAVREKLPQLEVLVVDQPGETGGGEAVLADMLRREPPAVEVVATGLHETSTIMYTSGTTGRPKGCLIPHRAVVSLQPYIRHVLGLQAGEVLFSGADTGWSFGLYTTGLAPMSLGVTRVIYEGGFDAAAWWRALAASGAHHLAAAPTAFRQLAATGAELVPAAFTAGTSAGEPLDAATVDWFREHTGVTLVDSYGLSELGMVIANLRTGGPAVAPGSMGGPIPGFEIALLDPDGHPVTDGGPGRIAVRDNGFFLSNGYWERMPEWRARFQGDWFLTEDVAHRDEEGRYWYEGRSDDVIVAAGYNVGPVEVEAALMESSLVRDVACIGVPDPMKGSVVAIYVVVDGPPPEDLREQLRRWVGERVGWHAAPRLVVAVDNLPRTESGKLQRAVVRSWTLDSQPPERRSSP